MAAESPSQCLGAADKANISGCKQKEARYTQIITIKKVPKSQGRVIYFCRTVYPIFERGGIK